STTSTSANISWITSEPSNYTISISDGSTSWTISNSTFDSSHLVTILDLSPNTTYYYNITIWDQAGNNNTYSNYNFTTNPSEQPGGQAEVVVTSAPEDREIFSLIVLILLFSFILNFKKLN
ncbi:MAG: fibronectin type III domain-containing protein, partial [archaeon]